jgi:Arc/MetJ-type ribon-helix-helix transcriptional regulator
MTNQKRAKQILDGERDATPRELQTWARANKDRLEKDLAEAEANLDKGEGKPWDLVEFLAEAERRRKKKARKR